MGGDWLTGISKLPNSIGGVTEDLSVVEEIGVSASRGLDALGTSGGYLSWINVG